MTKRKTSRGRQVQRNASEKDWYFAMLKLSAEQCIDHLGMLTRAAHAAGAREAEDLYNDGMRWVIRVMGPLSTQLLKHEAPYDVALRAMDDRLAESWGRLSDATYRGR